MEINLERLIEEIEKVGTPTTVLINPSSGDDNFIGFQAGKYGDYSGNRRYIEINDFNKIIELNKPSDEEDMYKILAKYIAQMFFVSIQGKNGYPEVMCLEKHGDMFPEK